MLKTLLNDSWLMRDRDRTYPCAVPCSAYDTLIRASAIPDPYYRENEWISTPVSDRDFTFERRFVPAGEMLAQDQVFLVFEGIDTLADVYLNGRLLGRTDNMHRTWRFPVRSLLVSGENLLLVEIHSPSVHVRRKYAERPLWGVDSTMEGYPYLRKAHCMFGWDWGPVLPDEGIWRDVSLQGFSEGRILDVYYAQRHEPGKVRLSCRASLDLWEEGIEAFWTVTAPDGQSWQAPLQDGTAEIALDHPLLWWVRGLGDQPLYTCRVELRKGSRILDAQERKIGLRILTVSQEEDAWGKEFCFLNNGVKIFAMGANYIPEDQIFPRLSRDRTEKLLQACVDANYNLIRVWGGGAYPDDWFYEFCDEHGLIVWQDFMFACSAYLLTPDFEATVRAEILDNVIRLRNHASLGLWCGNNEIESAWEGWNLPADPQAKADYLKLFESILPDILRQADPETFYWPSSPSSGGGFRDSSSNLAGDMHYWAVWHNFKPIEAFREFYYRFCSEYGFESLPDIKTIRTFAEESDLDLCGPVMEAHQKCTQGNEKVMYYLAQMVNYPCDFERLIYCSQLVQADCIRSNVEHMRRARGRCMGSVYWQVNDSNPVISWSSIDYFGRWKGLHYAARRFYAPLLLSCDDTDPLHPVLHVTNDTPRAESLRIVCRLRNHRAEILDSWQQEITSPALSSRAFLPLDLTEALASREDRRTRYLEYSLYREDQILSRGTTAFVRPKAFAYLPARITAEVRETEDRFLITLRADVFAKSVCLSLREDDAIFSDNWFDLHGAEPYTVFLRKADFAKPISAQELSGQLCIRSYCDA